jgi:hypothetical protein
MPDNKLSEDEAQIVLSLMVEKLSADSHSDMNNVLRKIRSKLDEEKRLGHDLTVKALEIINDKKITFTPPPSFQFRLQTPRTRAAVLLPYAFNDLEDLIDSSYGHEKLRSLFSESSMDEIEIAKGKRIRVDNHETAREMAQIIPALKWWTSGKMKWDGLDKTSFKDVGIEFAYRVYKYHRISEPIEKCLIDKLSSLKSETDEVREIGENILHDGKRGILTKGQMSNLLYELPEKSAKSLEECIALLKDESPFFLCPEMLSVMASDLASRICEYENDARPLLAVLCLTLMFEVFKVVPPVGTQYFTHIYQIGYEESYLLVLGKAIVDGFGIDISPTDLCDSVGGLVSMDLGIGKDRLVTMAENVLGLGLFPLGLSDYTKIEKMYREETESQEGTTE